MLDAEFNYSRYLISTHAVGEYVYKYMLACFFLAISTTTSFIAI